MELITPLVEKYPKNASFLYAYGLGMHKMGENQLALEAVRNSENNNPYYAHKVHRLKNDLEDLLEAQ